MRQFESLVSTLPDRHKNALEWFRTNIGNTVGWPEPLPNGTLLLTRAKGIYKPEWSAYALSVRQTLGAPYPDRDPLLRDDGTWIYQYYQELDNPDRRDESYGNVGLLECMKNSVPVGVLRQVTQTPRSTYKVLGIALVSGWDDGYFFLEGFNYAEVAREPGPHTELEALTRRIDTSTVAAFDPKNRLDARERKIREIVERRGQAEFRKKLLAAYGMKCAVSGCSVTEVLDAAHIMPYRGPHTNHVSNGILLRADLHNLFDLGLIAIDSNTLEVRISDILKGSEYYLLLGRRVNLPTNADEWPNREALAAQQEWSCLRN